MNDEQIEHEIQAKGLTAPRVTPEDIEANIASEHYFTGADGVLGAYKNNNDVRVESYKGDWEVPRSIQAVGLLTFCVLVLRNGFTVTGESACTSPKNFDAELGRKIARQNAVQKIWPLMGYALKERLHEEARGDINTFAQAQEAARRDILLAMCEELGVDQPEDLLAKLREMKGGV